MPAKIARSAHGAASIDDGLMQMPEPHVSAHRVRSASATSPAVFDHRVIVLLPSRRYRRRAIPGAAPGSPSVIELGEQTRFGDELIVGRTTSRPALTAQEQAEMTGELAEAWVALTAWRERWDVA